MMSGPLRPRRCIAPHGDKFAHLADLQFAAESERIPLMYEVLGDSLLAQKKAREAFIAYASAARMEQRPDIQVKQAYAMAQAAQLGPAESQLDQILTDHPRLQPAYHLRSRVRLSLLQNGFGTIEPY